MFICLEEGRCQLVVIYYASDTTEYGWEHQICL